MELVYTYTRQLNGHPLNTTEVNGALRRQFVLGIFILVTNYAFSSSACEESCQYHHHQDRCLVKSHSGTYQGRYKSSVLQHDYKYCSYTDIKYGEYSHRFEKPQLVKPLPPGFIYNATEDNKVCPQQLLPFSPNTYASDEDCLYLNVFTPKIYGIDEYQPLKAVLVWIHGGGFLERSKSSSEFGPDLLILHDIVIVTINYRLGPFGFMSLCIPECGCNMGLRDQLTALEWVQKNIQSFGGDPRKVTVAGESAGAISTWAIALSPLSKGLFRYIIVESCVSTDRIKSDVDILVKKTVFEFTIKFAIFLKYKGNVRDSNALLIFFRSFKTLEFLKHFYAFLDYLSETEDLFLYQLSPFGPFTDHCVPGAVFPEPLKELGKYIDDLSILYGINDADGDFYANPNFQPIADYVLTHLGTFIVNIEPGVGKNNRTLETAIAKTKEYYNPDGKNNEINEAIEVCTHLSYSYTEAEFITSYARGRQNYKKLLLGQYANLVKGASHVAEVEFLFYQTFFNPPGRLNATAEERDLICKMTFWWANYVKYGNPNGIGDYGCDHCTHGVYWGPTIPGHENYLQIGSQYSDKAEFYVNREILQKQREFFRSLPRIVGNGN